MNYRSTYPVPLQQCPHLNNMILDCFVMCYTSVEDTEKLEHLD